MNVLLVVNGRGETKRASHVAMMLKSPRSLFFLCVTDEAFESFAPTPFFPKAYDFCCMIFHSAVIFRNACVML